MFGAATVFFLAAMTMSLVGNFFLGLMFFVIGVALFAVGAAESGNR